MNVKDHETKKFENHTAEKWHVYGAASSLASSKPTLPTQVAYKENVCKKHPKSLSAG